MKMVNAKTTVCVFVLLCSTQLTEGMQCCAVQKVFLYPEAIDITMGGRKQSFQMPRSLFSTSV